MLTGYIESLYWSMEVWIGLIIPFDNFKTLICITVQMWLKTLVNLTVYINVWISTNSKVPVCVI